LAAIGLNKVTFHVLIIAEIAGLHSRRLRQKIKSRVGLNNISERKNATMEKPFYKLRASWKRTSITLIF